jgi:hypothetical protein
MSDPRADLSPLTISYAQPLSGAVAPAIRPTLLLVPNLLAVAVLFLRFTNNQSPFEVLVDYARTIRGGGRGRDLWDAMVTGPFLLAFPLAAWTLRLTHSPSTRRAERTTAWGVTCASAALTLVVSGFCATQLAKEPRFTSALIATLLLLALGAAGAWSLRRLMWSYAPALLAMTAAYAANATMTTLVVLSHHRWMPGSVVGAIVVIWQIVATAILFRRWRREAPVI